MLLLKLPLELIRGVTVHLDQPSLAAFARTSKLVKPLAVEQLYTRPVVRGQRSANGWTRTWDEWVSPFTAVKVKKGELSVPKIKELTFEAIENEPMKVASLRGCIEAGVFNKLTSLQVVTCDLDPGFFPFLLGPTSPLRKQMRTLCLGNAYGDAQGFTWTFGLDVFLPSVSFFEKHSSEDSQAVFRDLVERPWAARTVTALEAFDTRESLPESDRRRISKDYDYFSDKLNATMIDVDPNIEACVLSRKPTEYPFLALTSLGLCLSLQIGEEVFLVFCTNLFPALKHLALVGGVFFPHLLHEPDSDHPLVWFARRSTYYSTARKPIQPAQVEHKPHIYFIMPAWREPTWERLTHEEASTKRFNKYKGPKLETVNLAAVKIFWPIEG